MRILRKIFYTQGLPLFFTGVIFFSCQTRHSPDAPEKALRVRAFKTETGWGYQIESSEKVFIYQPVIPGISGNYAFKTAGDAMTAGTLMLEKIRKKRSPGITTRELDSLRVDYPGKDKGEEPEPGSISK